LWCGTRPNGLTDSREVDTERCRRCSPGRESAAGVMCVIRSDIVQGWDLSFIGTVQLRGLFGASVLAKLAMVNMKLDSTDDIAEKCDNSLPMLCAICDEMHDDVIITADCMDKLNDRLSFACNVVISGPLSLKT